MSTTGLRKRYAEAFSRYRENAAPMREAPIVSDDGFRVRTATPADIARIAAVHVASWNEHYRGILDDAEIDRRTVDVRIGHWANSLAIDGAVTFVAESDDGTTTYGFASALVLPDAPDGFDAYLGQLYLLASAKGRGIGRALLRAVAQQLAHRNCKNVALRVLRENPSRAFYEHLGARRVPGGISNDAGLFDDVVYAFDDLSTLL
jgi:ribosomal protein S18 acetylase RimI-like enzyme